MTDTQDIPLSAHSRETRESKRPNSEAPESARSVYYTQPESLKALGLLTDAEGDSGRQLGRIMSSTAIAEYWEG